MSGSKHDGKMNTLSPIELVVISDVLANFHDWPTADLVEEATTSILASLPTLSPEFVASVLNSYLDIDPETRFKAGFSHEAFVATKYENFCPSN